MDKTKLVGIGFLVVLGGALLFARAQENAPATPPTPTEQVAHDHDGDGVADHTDEAHAADAATTENGATEAATENGTTETGTTEASTEAAPITEPVTELKIEDIKEGTGAEAKPGDQLTMNYRGTLLNGKEFDSSFRPGREPFQFQLGAGQVIPGWDQGIQGMKVGGKRRLVIPAELAYGAASPSPDIPANSPLLFEVELLDVQNAG